MRRAQSLRPRRLALLVGSACLAIGAAQHAAAQTPPPGPETDPGGATPAAPPAAPPASMEAVPAAVPGGVPTPPTDAALPVSAPTGGSGLLSLGGWRVPPIITTGALAYDLRLGRGPGAIRTTEQLVTGTINATSYLYQPWFARVSGSLGLTFARTSSRGEEVGPLDQHSSRDRFTTGSARLDLFPRSRFPFEVHYEVNDSRIDSGSPGTFDYRTRAFGASQKYRPIDGRYNVNLSAERRIFDGVGGRDTLDTLVGDVNTHWKHNEASVGASQSRGEREQTDEQSLFRTLVGRHHYSPGSALSVDTTLNWTSTEDELSTFVNDLSILQWSSIGVWNPEGRPWTLSGGVRALIVNDEVSDNSSETYGATLGGSYEVNKNLRLTASGSVTGLHAAGDGASESYVAAVGASYQGDSIDLRGYRYDWFASGTLSGAHAGEESETTIGGQLGHTLTRSWDLGEQSSLGLNLAQSVSATRSQRDPEPEIPGVFDTSKFIVHNAALSWNSGTADRNGFARASYSDSAEIGGSRARFQLLNLQVSGTLQMDRNQSLVGDLTLQWSRQRSADTFDAGLGTIVPGQPVSSASRGGEISYRHSRLFDVPRLRFTSKLRMSQDVQDQPGVLALIPDRETRLWENRLDWNIGRLETQLILRFSWVDSERRSLLLWRVQRTFGN